MFLIISLLDFTTKYVQFIELINLTQIFYAMLAFIFIVHFAFILFNVIVERRVYYHFFMKKFCTKKYEADEENTHAKIGYRSKDNLFIYEKEWLNLHLYLSLLFNISSQYLLLNLNLIKNETCKIIIVLMSGEELEEISFTSEDIEKIVL